MVSKVYAEAAALEPRRTLTASGSGEQQALSDRTGRDSLVCDGTFALRRALWLTRGPRSAWAWPERLGCVGWGEGRRQPAALAGSPR
jgi:hypothetical protein